MTALAHRLAVIRDERGLAHRRSQLLGTRPEAASCWSQGKAHLCPSTKTARLGFGSLVDRLSDFYALT